MPWPSTRWGWAPEAFLGLLVKGTGSKHIWSLPLGSCVICALCFKYLTETRKEGVIWACGFRHCGKVIIVESVQWQGEWWRLFSSTVEREKNRERRGGGKRDREERGEKTGSGQD